MLKAKSITTSYYESDVPVTYHAVSAVALFKTP